NFEVIVEKCTFRVILYLVVKGKKTLFYFIELGITEAMNHERVFFYATASKAMTRFGDRCICVNGERRSIGLVCCNQYFDSRVVSGQLRNEAKRWDQQSQQCNL
ncbi:hypothetical protein ALC56_11188, partial [Trachymyrmex septentrionalis]